MRTNNKQVVKDMNRVYLIAYKHLAILLLLLALMGCSKDGSLSEPDTLDQLENPQDNLQDPLEMPQDNLLGSLEELENYYTVEFVDAMVDFDFNLNLGNTPPNIEGRFLISPFILEDSTIEADSALIGGQSQDYLAVFSNQDNIGLTIDLEGIQTSQVDNGSGSFITGANGAFAVYSKTTSLQGSFPAETAVAISGVLTANGIENIQFFGAMLDDNGDPENIYIENNTGRFLIDGDGFSPKQEGTSKLVRKGNLLSWIKNSD